MASTFVVGADGTESSSDALVWAARAALARQAVLELVYAVGHPLSGYEVAMDDAIDQHAKSVLHEQAVRAEEAAPGVRVRTELDRDTAARALTRRSRDATMVVVGSHRMTLAERVLTGSLAYQVVAGSHCPVAVVPRLADEDARRVVVGVDGSRDSLAAVALGARAADRAGCELHVVHAWEQPAMYVSLEYLTGFDEHLREAEEIVLGESVAGLAEQYPDLVIRRHLVEGRAASALLDATEGAHLLVVGSRGRQGVARMLLGSVSHAVVLGADCPVLVARA